MSVPGSLIKVNIDITGFYFSKTIEVPSGTTVADAMEKLTGTPVTTDSGVKATLNFSRDTRKFLTSIDLDFETAPIPRQDNAGAVGQLMPGIYGATDDELLTLQKGKGLLTWQFYVNAATFGPHNKVETIGNILNRRTSLPDGTTVRKIEPFASFKLTQDCLVTWRLIVIATGPAETVTAAYA